jgi:hypothetical protein
MTGDCHVRFCERLRGETPLCLLGERKKKKRMARKAKPPRPPVDRQEARTERQETRGKERLDFFAAWHLCVKKNPPRRTRNSAGQASVADSFGNESPTTTN